MSIFKSLSKFHEEVGKIKKSSINPHFKNRYADINNILETIREPLKQAGLCFVQLPMQGGLKTVIGSIEGEDQIESFVEYELSKKDMQGLGSAITYARRYALVSMLGLEAEDDDGNEASKKQEPPKQSDNQVFVAVCKKHGVDPKTIADRMGVKSSDPQTVKKAITDMAGLMEVIQGVKNGN